MRTLIVVVALAALTLTQAGCATAFRAGGRNAGVEAGAAIGPPAAPVVIQESTMPPPVAPQ
jgi:hypothetical protein